MTCLVHSTQASRQSTRYSTGREYSTAAYTVLQQETGWYSMTHETGWYSGIQGGTAGHRVVQQDTGWYRERSDIARHRLVQQDTRY